MLSVQDIRGVDRNLARRPGHRRNRPVGPWPNTRYPPAGQPGTPAAFTHGRPGKETTPVFGTANPPKGVSGAIRRLAHAFPDHRARHWLLLLAADRVEATGPRLRRLATFGLPAVIAGAAAATGMRRAHTSRGTGRSPRQQGPRRAPPPAEVPAGGWTWG